MTAVFTALLLSGATSAYAGILAPQCSSLWDLDEATVFENDFEVSVLAVLDDCNKSIQDDLFGYAALTEQGGTIVVGASHGGDDGFLDSEWQKGDRKNAIPHNHLVNLKEAVDDDTVDGECADIGGNALVESLSFESPGQTMFGGTILTGIDDDEIKIWEVPKVIDGTDALSNTAEVFTLGDLGENPTVVSFHLDETVDGVCVTIADDVVADLEDLARKVGGHSMVIDSNALLLAGLQSTAMWMLPVVAGAAGAGAYYIKTRMNKD